MPSLVLISTLNEIGSSPHGDVTAWRGGLNRARLNWPLGPGRSGR